MHALEQFRQETAAVCGAFVADTGWWIAWHDWSDALRVDGQSVVDPRFGQHHTAFCRSVKARLRSGGACSRCDLVVVREACAADPAVRVRCCHAGADEVHVPVHHREAFVGVAYLGQFRREAEQPSELPLLETAGIERVLAHGRLLQGWFHDLCRRVEQAKLTDGGGRGARILAFLDAHPEADLPALAAELGLSLTRTGHVVREATGQAFTELREARRLERAKHLLLIGDRPIKAVAEAAGVADPNYFTRWFRDRVGMTPTAWRRQGGERREA